MLILKARTDTGQVIFEGKKGKFQPLFQPLFLFVVRDGTPTNYELELLGNKIVKWKALGCRLGVSDPRLEQISQAHDQLSEKVYHMLKQWKQGKGSSEATYRALCDALRHELVQRQDLAEQFCYINGKCVYSTLYC